MTADDKPESERAASAANTDDAMPTEGPKMSELLSEAAADTEPTDEERSELEMTDKPAADLPDHSGPEHGAHPGGDIDGASTHAHGVAHDHGLAHTTPIWLLFGVLGALLVLTILTVAVTAVDLGAQGNLVVAMVIATVKAALVCVFFMHLLWDKKFNAILFLTSVLFLILFLAMATADRGEYQYLVDEYRAQQLQQK